MKPIIAISAAVLAIAGCHRSLDAIDPFGSTPPRMNFTLTCTGSANGECQQYTCRADAESDCHGVANGCVMAGHHWSGTAEGGQCTRIL